MSVFTTCTRIDRALSGIACIFGRGHGGLISFFDHALGRLANLLGWQERWAGGIAT